MTGLELGSGQNLKNDLDLQQAQQLSLSLCLPLAMAWAWQENSSTRQSSLV